MYVCLSTLKCLPLLLSAHASLQLPYFAQEVWDRRLGGGRGEVCGASRGCGKRTADEVLSYMMEKERG